tara:strand:+ start:316 stop:921 length:606 start_codon:yes stop_codon:yes gene_type:complete
LGVGLFFRLMDAQDVERVLVVLFRSGVPMTASDIAREMSFGHGWLGIDEADVAVAHLVDTGWLKPEGEGFLPSKNLEHVKIPLSWMPRPSRLLEAMPPSEQPAPHEAQAAPSPEKEADAPAKVGRSEPVESDDPRVRLEGRLVGFIARASGLDRAEVKRRAERKQHALRPCTSWLGLALVAHDQGLDMNAIVDALSPNAQP